MTDDAAPHPPRALVSVTEIRRRLGTRIDVRRDIEAVGLALSDVRVVDGGAVTIVGEAESISEGVVLTGLVSVPWVGACRRCLADVAGTASLDVREVYETHPVDGETWPLENDHIDVGPLLHDTALLALPLAPLCRPDCPGPAPDAYPAAVEGDADPDGEPGEATDPPRDPRWAALDQLHLDDDA